MSIPKIVGIEQEYAIKIKGNDFSPFDASCMLVNQYARKLGLRDSNVRMIWDYGHETPFQDIRGSLFGKRTGQEIIHEDQNRLINAALPNGARLYTDHAHPEYSTPECMTARDVIACDRAGERILLEAIGIVHNTLGSSILSLYKNNTDHQGHSYGCHENYLMDATAHQKGLIDDPQKAVRSLVPFLVTRQIFSGSGKVGTDHPKSPKTPYQISQRSEFMEHLFGLETMYARPIINTRDEHHADPKRFRRLHLIIGDANMNEWASFLKIGSTQIVLQMFEDGFIDDRLALKDPLNALRQISSRFDSPIEMEDGSHTTAMNIQRRFFDLAVTFCQTNLPSPVPESDIILAHWAAALDGLEHLKISSQFEIEDDPAELTRKLDWVLKLWMIDRYRKGKRLEWHDPSLKVLDLQYHNIDPRDSIYYRLKNQNLTEGLLDETDIQRLMRQPPDNTRAYFRGKCIEKFPQQMLLLNWEVVGFDFGDVHRMIPMLDPMKGTRSSFESIFNQVKTAQELLKLIES